MKNIKETKSFLPKPKNLVTSFTGLQDSVASLIVSNIKKNPTSTVALLLIICQQQLAQETLESLEVSN